MDQQGIPKEKTKSTIKIDSTPVSTRIFQNTRWYLMHDNGKNFYFRKSIPTENARFKIKSTKEGMDIQIFFLRKLNFGYYGSCTSKKQITAKKRERKKERRRKKKKKKLIY